MNKAFEGDTFIAKELIKLRDQFGLTHCIETGTQYGSTTIELCSIFENVTTIEADQIYFWEAVVRLSGLINAKVCFGRSEKLLKMPDVVKDSDNVLYYLDAHGDRVGGCPLKEELEIIASKNHKNVCIAIHDFKVPGKDFGFDTFDYELCYEEIEELLKLIYKNGFDYHYNEEADGAKQGIVYIYPVLKKMKEITVEDVKEWKKKLAESGIKSRNTTYNLPQGHIGNGIYRIHDGCLTNKAGWDAFQKELIKQWTEMFNKTNDMGYKKTLVEIFAEIGHFGPDIGCNDKGSNHHYLEDYDKLFKPFQSGCSILEIGLALGDSVKLWDRYFENSKIIGVDISVVFQSPLEGYRNDVKIIEADGTKPEFLDKIKESTFDIVVDDGSHMEADQIASFELLKGKMKPGGIYIIEDILAIEQNKQRFEALHDNCQVYDFRAVSGTFADCFILYRF